jgi:hypothetical protein
MLIVPQGFTPIRGESRATQLCCRNRPPGLRQDRSGGAGKYDGEQQTHQQIGDGRVGQQYSRK